MKTKNIFNNVPKNLEHEIFENILINKNLKIERIISQGHTTPASQWYDQDNNEWIIVLQGEAILSFSDKEDIRLKSGDYLNIPANTRHKVSWTDPNSQTIWLAVHF